LAGDSVLIRGIHGIGKSEIIQQFADNKGWYCESLFLSLMDESDLQGVPYIEEGVELFAEPSFIRRMKQASAEGKQCILFLDELNRASKYVQAAIFELVLNGRVNDHHLPKLNGQKTLIVAAINPSDSVYQTSEMDIALLDRFINIEVTIDVEGWLIWADNNNVHHSVVSFVKAYPDKLHCIDNDGIGSTPRSLVMLGKHVQNFDVIPEFMHFEIIEGRVGTAVGVLYSNFTKQFIKNISADDIIEFVNTVNKNGSITEANIQIAATEIHNMFIENMEPITQQDLSNRVIDKIIETGVDRHIGMPALVLLYSLNLETRTSILKTLKQNSLDKYLALVKIDFNKNLFRSSITL
jgi:hypothetical protein